MQYNGELTCAMGVTDLDRSIAWYQDMLGFTLLYRADGVAWCELVSPVANVTVGLSQNESVPIGGGATLTFGVTDVVAAQAELAAKGVRFDGDIRHIPGLVKLLTLFDPDQNPLMLFQSDAPS